MIVWNFLFYRFFRSIEYSCLLFDYIKFLLNITKNEEELKLDPLDTTVASTISSSVRSASGNNKWKMQFNTELLNLKNDSRNNPLFTTERYQQTLELITNAKLTRYSDRTEQEISLLRTYDVVNFGSQIKLVKSINSSEHDLTKKSIEQEIPDNHESYGVKKYNKMEKPNDFILLRRTSMIYLVEVVTSSLVVIEVVTSTAKFVEVITSMTNTVEVVTSTSHFVEVATSTTRIVEVVTSTRDFVEVATSSKFLSK